jgi:putative transposase
VLGVSPSGYYAWRKRPASLRKQRDGELLRRIRTIHAASRETYGRPRIFAELKDDGVRIGGKRVARLMCSAGIVGVSRRKKVFTTVRDRDARPAPDLVERRFTAPGPDRLWVADITYIPTWAGFLFLAVVVDAWSRKVVGWAMETHLRTELVLAALDLALAQRRPTGVIHHSNQGMQGGFKGSSQHLDTGELRWGREGVGRLIGRFVPRCSRRVGRRVGGVSIGSGSGRRSLGACRVRRRPRKPAADRSFRLRYWRMSTPDRNVRLSAK